MREEEIYRNFVDNGMGREITREETEKILKESADAGLVHGISNAACIGCGVCVHKCPTDSLKLIQREAISDPPENVRDYGMRFMADRRKGEPLLRG